MPVDLESIITVDIACQNRGSFVSVCVPSSDVFSLFISSGLWRSLSCLCLTADVSYTSTNSSGWWNLERNARRLRGAKKKQKNIQCTHTHTLESVTSCTQNMNVISSSKAPQRQRFSILFGHAPPRARKSFRPAHPRIENTFENERVLYSTGSLSRPTPPRPSRHISTSPHGDVVKCPFEK